jgi:phosphoglycerate dehydrogenase-like enzyme
MAGRDALSAAVVLADRFYLSEKALAELSGLGGHALADARGAADLAEKIGGSACVKVIVSEYIPLNDLVLSRAPALKGVIAYGAGYDHIDVAAMKRGGVQVCNCRGENSQAVAELAFGLMLCLLRRIHKVDPWVKAGGWEKSGMVLPEWACGGELWKKTLGIVGMGRIGTRVAGIAKGFDMEVMGYDPFMPPGLPERMGVRPAGLAEVLSRSDVVTLHVPLTRETEGMLGARTLAGVKPGMILVNTSRGRVVDEQALIEALQTGRISGAALDVFAVEPLPAGHPLTTMENVVLSPHLGALSREAGDRLSDSVVRQVRDIMEGRRPEGLIQTP